MPEPKLKRQPYLREPCIVYIYKTTEGEYHVSSRVDDDADFDESDGYFINEETLKREYTVLY
jgi:hypothetical protein